MRHELLVHYLNTIEQTILAYSDLHIDRYTEDILTRDRANLKIRICIEQNNVLEINEAIVIIDDRLTTLDYRYHYQNEQNQLIFATTAHLTFPTSSPHHKHLPHTVIACENQKFSKSYKKQSRSPLIHNQRLYYFNL